MNIPPKSRNERLGILIDEAIERYGWSFECAFRVCDLMVDILDDPAALLRLAQEMKHSCPDINVSPEQARQFIVH